MSSVIDVLPPLKDHPVYQDLVNGNSPLEVVLRNDNLVEKADDLKARIREVGASTMTLEGPATRILADDSAPDCLKDFAREVMDGVSQISNEIAELLVDLTATKDVITVLDGRK